MIPPVLIDLPASLQTERLLLRPPQQGDGHAFLEAVSESLLELRQFVGTLSWVACEQTLASAEAFCRNAQANFIARKDLAFLLYELETGTLVGAAGLHRIDWTLPKFEVGYWARTGAAGKGFISEAVRALTDFAFGSLNAARVELITDENNARSRAVAHRCGFELEGILRNENRQPDGTLRNTCVYARVPAEPWRARA